MLIERKYSKIEFDYDILYKTNLGHVYSVKLIIDVRHHDGFKVYYDLYQDLVTPAGDRKSIKIYEYQYQPESPEANLICLALYRKEVCNESDKAYSNYLFNIFHSRNQWVERLAENHKDNPSYWKCVKSIQSRN